MMNGSTQFDVRNGSHELVVVASGDVDMATKSDFAEVVGDVVTTDRTLVVDVSDVSFMDSSGLNVLVSASCARNPREPIHIRGASPHMRKIFAITGLHKVLVIEDSDVRARAQRFDFVSGL